MMEAGGYTVAVGGDTGSPLLDTLAGSTSETIFIIELTSRELEELEVSPNIGIITNLGREDIEYHGSLEKYWESIRNIMRNMSNADTLIFNPQHEIILHWLAECDAQQQPIDPSEQVDMSKSKLLGDFQALNYLMARTAAQALGVDRLTCQGAFAHFDPLPHRMQIVRTINGITFIDDAIATQPDAAATAIQIIIRKIGPVGCVLLGGEDTKNDYTELIRILSMLLIPKLVLFSAAGTRIKAELPDTYQPEIFQTDDMVKAVEWAGAHTPSGSVCLLSTAAPTHNLWKDFEEKGNQFHYAVNALK
jgi:UDP-N-acetylmuramoylalanine--D-glutamate ligase